jgi:hypothetical protein
VYVIEFPSLIDGYCTWWEVKLCNNEWKMKKKVTSAHGEG